MYWFLNSKGDLASLASSNESCFCLLFPVFGQAFVRISAHPPTWLETMPCISLFRTCFALFRPVSDVFRCWVWRGTPPGLKRICLVLFLFRPVCFSSLFLFAPFFFRPRHFPLFFSHFSSFSEVSLIVLNFVPIPFIFIFECPFFMFPFCSPC